MRLVLGILNVRFLCFFFLVFGFVVEVVFEEIYGGVFLVWVWAVDFFV